jgi:5'-phosphate synthase pdxT subunit
MKVGILALQGAVEPHRDHLKAAGVDVEFVRTRQQLTSDIAGLIIPGGESTTMLKLLHRFEMVEPLKEFAREKPIWGTCAGSILIAQKVTGPQQESFCFMDIDVERNSYGRQLESFSIPLAGNSAVAFIRAPRITRVGPDVHVLASFKNDPVWVSQGRHMASTFHAELGPDKPSTLHQEFIERCRRTDRALPPPRPETVNS